MEDVCLIIKPETSPPIRSALLQIYPCSDNRKWWHFKCINLEDNKEFIESGKLWYLGDTCRNSGLEVSHWDDEKFVDVVKLIILMERRITLVWTDDNFNNLYPDHFEGSLSLLRRRLKYLKYNSRLLDMIEKSHMGLVEISITICDHCKHQFKSKDAYNMHIKAKCHGEYRNKPMKKRNANKKEKNIYSKYKNNCEFSIED